MNEKERFEKFRRELTQRAMADLEPMIQTAVERAVTADIASREALSALAAVGRQVERLEFAATFDEEDREKVLQSTLMVDAMIQQFERETFVYFIEAGDYIKIGYSRDPIGRLVQIRSGRGVKLPDGLDPSRARILTVEPGTHSHEKRLHDRFAEHRAAGEWFNKNDRLTHYIKSITTPA